MTKKIRQAIIPAAGLGTRFLPTTKIVPKELLPLAEKPCIHHIITEAMQAGIEEFIIVISKGKKALEDYFRPNPYLDTWLLSRHKQDIYNELKALETAATFSFAYQDMPLGLGHAVLCAQRFIRDDDFLVLLPDDIIDATVPVCQQMIDVFSKENKPLVAVMEVGWDQVHQYGIVQANPLSEKLGQISNIIEKPKREDAPSNLAVIGRYILPKEIFQVLEKTAPGTGEEIQLTDALKHIIPTHGIQSYAFKGERYDTGNPLGLLKASLVFSLKNPQMQEPLKAFMKMLAASY